MITPRVLLFDVFGTVVDRRGSITREARALAADRSSDFVADDFLLLASQLGV